MTDKLRVRINYYWATCMLIIHDVCIFACLLVLTQYTVLQSQSAICTLEFETAISYSRYHVGHFRYLLHFVSVLATISSAIWRVRRISNVVIFISAVDAD